MKKLLTLIVAAFMCVTCAFGLTACGAATRDLDDILSSGKLTVATNAEFPPFEAKEGENYVGIDIDIAKAIADYLGVQLVINNMEFEAVVTSVQKGQSDLALAALTISEDRLKAIDFSTAYFGAAQYLVVAKNDTAFDNCVTSDDVVSVLSALPAGTKAAAQTATTGFYYIKGSEDFGFPGVANLTAVSFDTAALAAEEVANGRAKVAVVDDEVANQIVAANDGVKVIRIALSSEEYGIGINKANKGLTFVVNKVLAELDASGALDAIFAKHLAE